MKSTWGIAVCAASILALADAVTAGEPIAPFGPPLAVTRTTRTASNGRYDQSATTVGTKALFGGGGTQSLFGVYDTVDVYDSATGQWSVEHLSVKRTALAATTVGHIAIFAGGAPNYHLDDGLDAVDLYDNSTGAWSTAKLSQPRNSLAAASVGAKAYFSGGVIDRSENAYSNVIDVYDANAKSWSTMSMPHTRYEHSSVSVGGKILFAGGADGISTVDIYDPATGAWSEGQLSIGRANMAAAVVADVAVFVGGVRSAQFRDEIDLYNSTTNTWSTATLPQRIAYLGAASLGHKAFFAGGTASSYLDVIYVYDVFTEEWTTTTVGLSDPRHDMAAATAGDSIIFSGGFLSDAIDRFEVLDADATKTFARSVPFGSTWKYLDNGTNQGTAWRDLEFDDAAWSSGRGELGYGDGDEKTVIRCGTSINCRSGNFATAYFRHEFELAPDAEITDMLATLVRDDAAAVYVNGVEVFRDSNLALNAFYNTYAASASDDNARITFPIDVSLLEHGKNVISVEVHQQSPTSTDVSFDLELRSLAVAVAVPEPATFVPMALGLVLCAVAKRRSCARDGLKHKA